MGTIIRPELSKRNKYWVEKHRYYELKHFCLQYDYWKKAYKMCDSDTGDFDNLGIQNNKVSNPTEYRAMLRMYYSDKIDMVKKVARKTDEYLADYIIKAVTTGISYDILKVQTNIPCCRETYYNLYRRFFWLLDKEHA